MKRKCPINIIKEMKKMLIKTYHQILYAPGVTKFSLDLIQVNLFYYKIPFIAYYSVLFLKIFIYLA